MEGSRGVASATIMKDERNDLMGPDSYRHRGGARQISRSDGRVKSHAATQPEEEAGAAPASPRPATRVLPVVGRSPPAADATAIVRRQIEQPVAQ
eukprot:1346810-Pyramimonas_sp.AAC.1